MPRLEQFKHYSIKEFKKIAGKTAANAFLLSPAILNPESQSIVPSLNPTIHPYGRHVLCEKGIPSVEAFENFIAEIKTSNQTGVFTNAEWNVLRAAATLFAAGSVIGAEAARRRQMEAASKGTKNMSKAGMCIVTTGVGAALYVIWNMDKI